MHRSVRIHPHHYREPRFKDVSKNYAERRACYHIGKEQRGKCGLEEFNDVLWNDDGNHSSSTHSTELNKRLQPPFALDFHFLFSASTLNNSEPFYQPPLQKRQETNSLHQSCLNQTHELLEYICTNIISGRSF